MKVFRKVRLTSLVIVLAIVLCLFCVCQAFAADEPSDPDDNGNSNWTEEDVSDVKNSVDDVNQNLKDTKKSVDDVNNSVNDVNNSVKEVNKNITDSNVDTSGLSNTIGGIKIQPVGIVSSAITAIVKLPTLLTNWQACSPLDLGYLFGHHIQADCVSSQVNQRLWGTAGLICDFLAALAIFYVVVKIATSIYLAKEDPVGIAGGSTK